VESRNASDLHVLALPLAYIYARNVLVLSTPKPNKEMFAAFLDWARGAYKTVYFLGEGGTDLISPRFGVTVVANEQFQVPEYQSLRNAYPTRARLKPFDFGIYRFEPPRVHDGASSLDLGTRDDLHVLRFHAKEHNDEATFRWTRDVSYVSLLGVEPSTRQLVLVMSNGGRPDRLPPATVEVFLDDRRLGAVTVGNGFRPYTFDIPPDVAAAASGTADAALVKIVSSTWNPRAALGAGDDRDLGVMIDRVDVH
jgi:hypothetical protein